MLFGSRLEVDPYEATGMFHDKCRDLSTYVAGWNKGANGVP